MQPEPHSSPHWLMVWSRSWFAAGQHSMRRRYNSRKEPIKLCVMFYSGGWASSFLTLYCFFLPSPLSHSTYTCGWKCKCKRRFPLVLLFVLAWDETEKGDNWSVVRCTRGDWLLILCLHKLKCQLESAVSCSLPRHRPRSVCVCVRWLMSLQPGCVSSVLILLLCPCSHPGCQCGARPPREDRRSWRSR